MRIEILYDTIIRYFDYRKYMIRIASPVFSFLFIILFTGCIEPYDLEYDANEYLLVVDGKITQKNTRHSVFLRRSTATGSGKFIPVTEAEITLFDQLGNSEKYIEEDNGEYYLPGNKMDRYPGNSYYIEILLKNDKL